VRGRRDDHDLAGLRAFLEKTPRCRAALPGYGGRDIVKLGDRLRAVLLAAALEKRTPYAACMFPP
jgi:hypothetical protein